MALLSILLRVSGTDLEGASDRIDGALEEVKDRASTVLLARNRARFQQEQDPEGDPWPPSQSALIRKAGGFTISNGRRVTGGGTLFATGRLFHSITVGRLGEDRRVFTDVPYAAIHHEGAGGQVQRQILGANDSDLEAVEDVFIHLVNKALK